MRSDKFEKRLSAIEGRNLDFDIICRFPSSEEATANILSNGMKIDRSESENALVIDLQWATPTHINDTIKTQWLRQYTPEKIEEFRQIWARSSQKRDRVALAELERLLH